ncbi:MASE3 domain-containing protein [Azospirillum sp.]|uniref:MASE3 domain-containing protein n=1 Tax=Azospirillum sp. TaxID=34012 RepID=UPI002D5B08D1|nr:MASE3 domain-containing protein [Azospirillum sp.]HYD66801.1 MASE3 domain-containing protein [Azospirillum sp.]
MTDLQRVPESSPLPRTVRRAGAAALPVLGAAALLYLSFTAFLVFHTAVEAASVLVALGTFTVAWYSRRLLHDNHMLLLGTAYLYVAAIDTLHTLAYKGMEVIPGADANMATQFWIIARAIECAGFLLAVARPLERHAAWRLHLGFGGAAALGTLSVLVWPVFPDCFVPGTGLTPFKIGSEYAIVAGYAVVLALLHANRRRFDRQILVFLVWATLARIVSELAFTLYVDVYGIANAVGHLLKIAACFFVFRAVVETGLVRPQALIARAVEREQELAAEVARQARTLDAILTATPDAVMMVGRDCSLTFANRAAVDLLRLPPGAWRGRCWRDLNLPPETMEPVEHEVRAVFDDGRPRAGLMRLGERTHDLRLTPLFDAPFPDGGMAAQSVLIVCRDVTDREQAEAKLREALIEQDRSRRAAERANAAKTRFLAAASHDLRQPVQALLLFVHALYDRLDGHPAGTLVDTMRQALDALKALLDGLLDISKLEAGVVVPEVRPFAVAALFERLSAEYAPRMAEKGLRLRVVGSSAWVESDPTLLLRILRNLLENALRYTQSGGVLLGCRRQGDKLRLIVADTGPGIPRDRLDDIFEEFVQIANTERDRAQGLGLGLAIVKRLANLLDHPVDVRTAPGRGSCFTIGVPPVQPPHAAAPAGRAGAEAPERGFAIIIDDESIILDGMRALLESWGFDVETALSADEALRALAARGRPPDVLISDYRLGGGRTGVEAIRAVRDAWGDAVPSILLTGDTGPDRLVEAQRSGVDVLHKPVTPGQLRALIHTVRERALEDAD